MGLLNRNVLCHLLSMSLLLLPAIRSQAQATYNRQFAIYAPGNFSGGLSYSGEYGSKAIVIYGNGIIVFDQATGAVLHSSYINVQGHYTYITGAFRSGDALYVVMTYNGSVTQGNCLLKFDLLTNAIVWQREVAIPGGQSSLRYITGDNVGNLFIAGTVHNAAFENNDLMLLKIDADGSIIWTERIGKDTIDEEPLGICYRNDNEIYVTLTGFIENNPFGKSILLRTNNAGALLYTNAITSAGAPRLAGGNAGIVNNKLCIVDKTIIGPSDPGPVYIRVLDTALTTLSSSCFRGMLPGQAFFGDKYLLITGQAPVTSGFPGFRALRYNSELQLTGGRYFNKIVTGSIANSEACFINSNNESFHFFKVSSKDTLHVIKADSTEYTGCNDTSYVPSAGTANYIADDYVPEIHSLTATYTTVDAVSAAAEIVVLNQCFPEEVPAQTTMAGNGLTVYPNPASTSITIDYNSNGPAFIQVSDLLGKTVLSQPGGHTINVSALVPGTYFVRIIVKDKVVTRSFIKE